MCSVIKSWNNRRQIRKQNKKLFHQTQYKIAKLHTQLGLLNKEFDFEKEYDEEGGPHWPVDSESYIKHYIDRDDYKDMMKDKEDERKQIQSKIEKLENLENLTTSLAK